MINRCEWIGVHSFVVCGRQGVKEIVINRIRCTISVNVNVLKDSWLRIVCTLLVSI